MAAPDWLDGLDWKAVRHKDAPDEEMWAARVARERTLQLTYDEERAPYPLGAEMGHSSQGSFVKPQVAPASQPERINVRVYRGDQIIGANGKAWAVPNIVYLYTYREVN